jgi:hypothetical protein
MAKRLYKVLNIDPGLILEFSQVEKSPFKRHKISRKVFSGASGRIKSWSLVASLICFLIFLSS